MLELEYTYTEEPDGWLVGYLNKYPGRLTQGKDVAELEHMLTDIYAILQDGTMLVELEWEPAGRLQTGVIRVGAEVLV